MLRRRGKGARKGWFVVRKGKSLGNLKADAAVSELRGVYTNKEGISSKKEKLQRKRGQFTRGIHKKTSER